MKYMKYQIGSEPKECELRENYLGWLPEGNKDWEDMFLEFTKNTELTIVNPKGSVRRKIFLHHFIIKDAFPMSFFGEKRSNNWGVFAIVSKEKTSERFIIPLY